MTHLENIVRQLLNLDYTYEHVGSQGIQELTVNAHPIGYVYFKSEDLLPILSAMERQLNDSN